jgi:hypothetical protein
MDALEGGDFQRPQSVFDAEFASRVRKHLESRDPWQQVLTEVAAVGAAQSLGLTGVAEVVREAPRISESAKKLLGSERGERG